ncbi:MAG: hypothetical protein IKF97_00400 [Clostridia bacterium]|nr:hypothetical protein [Clostridia bacterium]
MKKLFGGINLTWVKVILLAIFSGAYTAVMCMIPAVKETSFTDLTVTFEVWVLFGIFIIMNSKSAKDSALKCFVFFLISQPLVYLIQDVVNHSNLFVTYYRYWFIWTVFTLPMGFIGYYMKKDKWWGLIILTPILLLVGTSYEMYLARTIFSFPKHILTTIFCTITLIIYPIAIFKNKKIRIIGAIISIAIIITMTVLVLLNPYVYNTTLLLSGGKMDVTFNDSYNAYLTDKSYGDVYFEYEDGLEDWMLKVNFKKAGKTELVLEAPNGEKTMFDVTIGYDAYDITKK